MACKKGEPIDQQPPQLVNLLFTGYVMTDTLEFVKNGKVICTAIDNNFSMNGNSFIADENIQVRKKGDSKVISEFVIPKSPFSQNRKFFYDGATLSDNIVLTAVSDQKNIGMRFRFSTTYPYFYGGPVDIEIYEQQIDYSTFKFTYTSVRLIKNITGAFGDFVELPALVSTPVLGKNYIVKVYKAGTTDYPYTAEADYSWMADPVNNYSSSIRLLAGESGLISISDGGFYEQYLYDGYEVKDFSNAFK